MDPIFDFIFDEQQTTPSGFDQAQPLLLRVPDMSKPSLVLQSVPSSLSMLSLEEKPAPLLGEDVKGESQANFGPPVMSPQLRSALVGLIEEYLTEGITLKHFLQKVQHYLCEEGNSKQAFEWILRCILESGHTSRMATFLEEQGVSKDDIEHAIINKDTEEGSDNEFDIGEKRKRRDRKRVSISKGLRSPPNKWSKAESQKLIRLVFEYGDKSWKKIAEQLGGGKTGAQCAQHWKRVLSPEIRKGSWDDQEEALLFNLVAKHGQSWKNIAAEIKTRTDIQCRYQYQKACLSRQCAWLPQEDVLLKKKVTLCLQERRSIIWTDVSKFIARAKLTKIPRTALECKERWSLLNANSVAAYNNTSATLVYNNLPYSSTISNPLPLPSTSTPAHSSSSEKPSNSTPLTTTSATILVC